MTKIEPTSEAWIEKLIAETYLVVHSGNDGDTDKQDLHMKLADYYKEKVIETAREEGRQQAKEELYQEFRSLLKF